MPRSKVTVLGTGVLGSQIAFQAAFHGFDVTAYDVSDEVARPRPRERFDAARRRVRSTTRGRATARAARARAASTRIRLTADLARGGRRCRPRDRGRAREPRAQARALRRSSPGAAPETTIFATNSSTLLPSDLKDFTGRPDRFLALHYANHVWRQNTAEVMGTADTDPAVYERGRRLRRRRSGHGADRAEEGEGGLRAQLAARAAAQRGRRAARRAASPIPRRSTRPGGSRTGAPARPVPDLRRRSA